MGKSKDIWPLVLAFGAITILWLVLNIALVLPRAH